MKTTPGFCSKLQFLPPILLCLIAVNHWYLSTTDVLSHWKGGGFAMFSHFGKRTLRISITTNRGVVPFAADNLGFMGKEILEYPNDRILIRAVEKIRNQRLLWKFGDRSRKTLIDLPNDYPVTNKKQFAQIQSVRFEIFQISFSHTKKTLSADPIIDRTINSREF